MASVALMWSPLPRMEAACPLAGRLDRQVFPGQDTRLGNIYLVSEVNCHPAAPGGNPCTSSTARQRAARPAARDPRRRHTPGHTHTARSGPTPAACPTSRPELYEFILVIDPPRSCRGTAICRSVTVTTFQTPLWMPKRASVSAATQGRRATASETWVAHSIIRPTRNSKLASNRARRRLTMTVPITPPAAEHASSTPYPRQLVAAQRLICLPCVLPSDSIAAAFRDS